MGLAHVMTLVMVWVWTWILHYWAMQEASRQPPEYWEDYGTDLCVWTQTYSIFDLSSYKFHPSWRNRYLHCSCYNYAVAYARVFSRQVEMMTNESGKMIHVYNVTKRKYNDKKTIRCIDMDGKHTRQKIKSKYGLTNWRVMPYHDDDDTREPIRMWGEIFVLERFIRNTHQ